MKLSRRLIKKDDPLYDEIGNQIQSKDSVVGINARHTHILIIKKLVELEEKLEKLNSQVKKLSKKSKKK